MTPEKWAQIAQLFDAALHMSSRERTEFLERQCPGDLKMQNEVQRLLRNHEGAGSFLSQSLLPTASLTEGTVIANRYRIISLIGRGGMGEVYQAEDQLLRETVAIKKLRADVAGDEGIARQFQKEIQLARKVTHDNICRVFEVGVDQSKDVNSTRILFFTMELLDGETLSSKIHREGRFSFETALPIAEQMAEGLAAAHRAGVVHTDFKSGNVILVPSSAGGVRAVITDFGLARRDPAMLAPDVTRTMISDGRIAGTVAYMSPEQLEGGKITPASDIYSFGIVLFEMATGQLPFDEHHVIHSAMQRADPETVSVRSLVPDIDPRWERAILRCLQKNPADRFDSAEDLAACFRGGPNWAPRLWTRRDWIKVSSAAVFSLASASGLWLWFHRPYRPPPAALEWFEKGLNAMHSMTYEAARKALEQSVSVDPNFALAHAMLARTYEEMDYSDRAKDSMLHSVTVAQESQLSSSDARRLRALQFIISRDYDRAVPLVQQLEDEVDGREKASAALESGWLAQQREDTEAAQAAYERALKLEPNYAAAKLRLGFILGRRGKDDLALQTFTEAENLYSKLSDYEGITETLLQRANLLNRRSRAAEAMPTIDKALTVARTVGNRYQEIRLLLLQGVAVRILGQNTRAGQLAQQAIDAAEAENMDNLASSGLLDLGNSFLIRGDLKTAEPIFRRALDLARRGKVRRNEARAKGSLGSLCEQDHRPEEARRFAEDILPFYRQAGYRRELIQTMTFVAGVYEQLGEYEEGVRVSREALAGTLQLRDSRSEALARERLGGNLHSLGSWTEALEEYRHAVDLLGPGLQGGTSRLVCSQLYWWLGRRQDASDFLEEVQKVLAKEPNQRLMAMVNARKAEVAYDDGHWNEVLALSREGLSMEARSDDAERDLSMFQATALIRIGRTAQGTELAANLIRKLEQDKLIGSAASARLVLAEAWMGVGQRSTVRQLASEALDFFEARQIFESVWRAHALIAQASEDPREAEVHRVKAGMALMQLKARWPAGSIDRYLERPAIRQLSTWVRF